MVHQNETVHSKESQLSLYNQTKASLHLNDIEKELLPFLPSMVSKCFNKVQSLKLFQKLLKTFLAID